MTSPQDTQARTAPVIKHICLYTHDLKRKHKRWQDGRLEFHTFNRRVMVYDELGNLVGDSHRTKDRDVEDGDEFQLDRGNVIIQVAERIGQREQNITELFARKVKPTEALSQSTVKLLTPKAKTGMKTPGSHFQMRHLSLPSLLSTPGRRTGRAMVPSTSPFEQRQIAQTLNETETERQSKRRKLDTTLSDKNSSTTIILDDSPSPPSQPTISTPQTPCNPPRRKAFSPPKRRNVCYTPTAAHGNSSLDNSAVRQQGTARLGRTNPPNRSSGLPEPMQDHSAPVTELRQKATESQLSRPANAAPKVPARRRDLLAGKENRDTIRQRERKDDARTDENLPATDEAVSKAAQIDPLDKIMPPEEPTTALRLGSAQRRRLLVAKEPPSRRLARDRMSTRLASSGGRDDSRKTAMSARAVETISVEDTGKRDRPTAEATPAEDMRQRVKPAAERILTEDTRQRRTASDSSLVVDVRNNSSGGQLVAMAVKPDTQAPTGGGAWSREADDLLEYKRGTRVYPTK